MEIEKNPIIESQVQERVGEFETWSWHKI